MKSRLLLLVLLFIFSCNQKQQVDLIVTNANVYTVDAEFSKASSFAVLDGKFIEVGSDDEILNNFFSESILDVEGNTIIPGLIDAHCHFLRLGQDQATVDLMGTESYEEVLEKIIAYQEKYNADFIQGRGWDQNDWPEKTFPNKRKLDSLFPNTPISLTRVDGHAILCNQAALDLGKVTAASKVDGGEVVLEEGKPSGVLIDNAENLVMKYWPKSSVNERIIALKAAENICLSYGLTTVNDAGLATAEIATIDSLQTNEDLKIRVYAMVSASKENVDHWLNRGFLKTDRLNVRSFKFYADGALGSRGAMLRQPYNDKPDHYGLMVTALDEFEAAAERIAASEFQMNTHAIGDSANHSVLNIYGKVLNKRKDRRWKIEHAQVISPEDFAKFDNILPSVQPTHATSDMYWAGLRLGNNRVKGAYAFKQLLDMYGKVAIGTDFPVEYVSPFYTFYAAVARKDLKQYPEGGFQPENGLTREETLKGMTIWAAYSNFEENEKGSIEAGKMADFVILEDDIMTMNIDDVPNLKVQSTYIAGEKLFSK